MKSLALAFAVLAAVCFLTAPVVACDAAFGVGCGQQFYAQQSFSAPVYAQAQVVQSYAVPVQQQRVIVQKQFVPVQRQVVQKQFVPVQKQVVVKQQRVFAAPQKVVVQRQPVFRSRLFGGRSVARSRSVVRGGASAQVQAQAGF